MARAVEPFFSTKEFGKGTGLSLSMVHGLASQLGGALKISSTLGVGTAVQLWLPVSDDTAGEIEPAIESPGERSVSGVVLLVDDEEVVRLTAADMLADLDFEVVEASSAENALEAIKRGQHFNLLVTDHVMPGMTGAELAQHVRYHLAEYPHPDHLRIWGRRGNLARHSSPGQAFPTI